MCSATAGAGAANTFFFFKLYAGQPEVHTFSSPELLPSDCGVAPSLVSRLGDLSQLQGVRIGAQIP